MKKKSLGLLWLAIAIVGLLSLGTSLSNGKGIKTDGILTGRFQQEDKEGGWEGQQAYAIPHHKKYTPMIYGGVKTKVGTKTYSYPFGTAGISVQHNGVDYIAKYPDASHPEKLAYVVAWADDTNVYVKVMHPSSPLIFDYKIHLIEE